jgi:RNA polymerase sigma-70 factor (ECF subfamily)
MAKGREFEDLVAAHYEPLYQFAFSLTREAAGACDLVQQTFCVWAAKGHQLRDESKVKTWLFTTLHREFLGSRRRHARFPHLDLDFAEAELPVVEPVSISRMDLDLVLEALASLDESFQAPVALFYLQDYSYREIAEILGVPIGTVKSRLARGLGRLHEMLADKDTGAPQKKSGQENEIL